MSDDRNPKDIAADGRVPLELMPPAGEIMTCLVLADGANEYGGSFNWRDKPIGLKKYVAAIRRHALAMLDGEWIDPKSGKPHAAHISAGACIVLDADACGTLKHDTRKNGPGPALLTKWTKVAPLAPADLVDSVMGEIDWNTVRPVGDPITISHVGGDEVNEEALADLQGDVPDIMDRSLTDC